MFYLDLKKVNEVVTIPFKELDHSLAKKWAETLKSHIENNHEVAQPDRIYNLNTEWSIEKIIENINLCIDGINRYRYFIDFRLTSPDRITQVDFNKLHHYFELMRGENDLPNEFYQNSPPEIKKYIEDYNVLIHRWEDYGTPGRIVVHLKNRFMYDLSDDDYRHWTLNYQPGDVRLNYCHKGKTIWDIFKDNDQEIGDSNIRPQRRYSPDFNISFGRGPSFDSPIFERYLIWWEKMEPKLNELGFFKNDPKCAIGHAIIGKVVGNVSEIKNKILGSTEILGVRFDNT
jgi:hypothetical protein